MKFKLVFFDCDGVLNRDESWIRLHRAVGIPEELDTRWFNEYFSGKISNVRWIMNIESYYLQRGLTRSLFEKTLSEFEIDLEAYSLIDYLKERKIKTAVISSGIDFYVKPIAQELGLNFWRANYTFDFDGEGKFKRIDYRGDEEKVKVADIREICQRLKIKPTQTIFVGNSFNDREAFKLTKHGVLYKTEDDDLRKIAWKTIKNLSEIKDLLGD
jgi:phosphoserine phosphatase